MRCPETAAPSVPHLAHPRFVSVLARPQKTLRYEVSLGSFPFATNMAQWISTSETSSGFSSQLFSRPRPVYYVRVVAVNAAGLWTEHTEKITGPL